MTTLPVFFISHGGGPWPWVQDMRTQFKITEDNLRELGKKYKPKSILCVTAHWEENSFTVGTVANPPMIYDYSGFPSYTYTVKYEAPGAPELGLKVKALLSQKGFSVNVDSTRGYDHGTFVPLYVMYPEANIPVAQLSIKRDLNPQEHLKMGEALRSLRDEGVLIVCSGLSYHNLRAFFRGGAIPSREFDVWLTKAVKAPAIERNKLLEDWEKAPSARMAHPREDHLIPLMVAAGAAGNDKGELLFLDTAFDVMMSSYIFGQTHE